MKYCTGRRMADRHAMAYRCVPVKKEFSPNQANAEISQMASLCVKNKKSAVMKKVEKAEPKVEDTDDIPYLCGKPFFYVVLSKSQVSPHCCMRLPTDMKQFLPDATVPVVLRHNLKNWDARYMATNRLFDCGWKKFVIDNDLAAGDACVFELLECSHTKIKFKVHILRGSLPPELLQAIDSCGTQENPIDIDSSS